MKRTIVLALSASTALLLPQVSSAAVYMCVDPVTGNKTFTDRACPTSAGKGKKVRVEPTNFGGGTARKNSGGTWSQDRDRSVSGRANLSKKPHAAPTASGGGLPHDKP